MKKLKESDQGLREKNYRDGTKIHTLPTGDKADGM